MGVCNNPQLGPTRMMSAPPAAKRSKRTTQQTHEQSNTKHTASVPATKALKHNTANETLIYVLHIHSQGMESRAQLRNYISMAEHAILGIALQRHQFQVGSRRRLPVCQTPLDTRGFWYYPSIFFFGLTFLA